MTTAVDSNVLIDVIGSETGFTALAIDSLDRARTRGALIMCSIAAPKSLLTSPRRGIWSCRCREMSIRLSDLRVRELHQAGTAYVAYRKRGSKPKDRMLADFLVGAHALHQSDALLTRDRGYYRTYFPRLKLIDLED